MTMDYEKKYKEALERANIIYTGKYKSEIAAWTKKSLEAIFPELVESEDEKIRKAIIDLIIENIGQGIMNHNNVDCDDMIAWLEKQGQVKEITISQHENKTCKENDDSITSEDERIRKAISQCVEDMRGQFEKLYSVHHKDAIAWLEKQPKKNWCDAELEKQGEQKAILDDLEITLSVSEDAYLRSNLEKLIKEFKNDTGRKTELLKVDGFWTDEDESKVEDIVYFLDTAKIHYASTKALDDCITWVKSLKQRMEEQQ